MPTQADFCAGNLDQIAGADYAVIACKFGAYNFRVVADATPDVFSRIANLFTLANIAPRRAVLSTNVDGTTTVEVLLTGISGAVADRIVRKLHQQILVVSVAIEYED